MLFNPKHDNALHRAAAETCGVDAALARIVAQAPEWKLRRLVYEDGEWCCTLSRQPDLPLDLDDTADGRDETIASAIVAALTEARARTAGSRAAAAMTPRAQPALGCAACCDDFS